MSGRRRTAIAMTVGLCWLLAVPTGGAGAAALEHQGRSGSLTRAPSGPPLVGASAAARPESVALPESDEEAASGVEGDADPLVGNGLRSPLCADAPTRTQLSISERRDCESSGFVAAPAPTGNYGIDVHIDSGPLGIGDLLLSTVQDLFVNPLWTAIVWSVHALLVMVEWAFTIDLLDSPAAGGLASSLRRMQASLTEPWLTSVLAAASVLAAYEGLLRRRVGQTLAEVLAMAAMMAAALWLIAEPTGTVGALAAWANDASEGTLAVASSGSAGDAGRALADGATEVFSEAVEAPWCYMEFGAVDWCRDAASLDPRLRRAALAIAAQELAGCRRDGAAACTPTAGTQAAPLLLSAQLLTRARSNGEFFLALPPNGPGRNSINDQGSLLRTLCESSQATECRGPTASEAEFRTQNGTWPRVVGLLLIAGGVLGMLLLIGFLTVRLLTAALFSLALVLLAPAMVLSPAFGEWGRGLFRRWAARLLGAVLSKLLFAFLLGVVLTVSATLGGLSPLGWWAQWLLTAAFWWSAFVNRHAILAATGTVAYVRHRPGHSVPVRVRGVADSPRRLRNALRRAREERDAVREGREAARSDGRADASPTGRSPTRPRPPTGLPPEPQIPRLPACWSTTSARPPSAYACDGPTRRPAAEALSWSGFVEHGSEPPRRATRAERSNCSIAGSASSTSLTGSATTWISPAALSRRASSGADRGARLGSASSWRNASSCSTPRPGFQARSRPPAVGPRPVGTIVPWHRSPATTARDTNAWTPARSAPSIWRSIRRLAARPAHGRSVSESGSERPDSMAKIDAPARDDREEAPPTRPSRASCETRARSQPAANGSWAMDVRDTRARRLDARVGRLARRRGRVDRFDGPGGRARNAGERLGRCRGARRPVPRRSGLRSGPERNPRPLPGTLRAGGRGLRPGLGDPCRHRQGGVRPRRDPDPSCTREGAVNSAGAGGPMQFLASTWAEYGVDGDGDGALDRWDPADAIFAAANFLRSNGAPDDYERALLAYNDAGWYVSEVETWARRYSAPAAESSFPSPCSWSAATPRRASLPNIPRRGSCRSRANARCSLRETDTSL